MISTAVAIVFAVASSVNAAPTQALGPDPGSVYITGLSYGGTGCPQGTVASSFSSDQTVVTLLFDQFIASSGPNVPVTSQRKDCQINMALNYPPGWSYSVASVEYRGYAQVPAGVSAQQSSTYYFTGQTQQVKGSTTFTGPYANDYHAKDQIPVNQFVWSPCGENMNGNIKTAVQVYGSPQALAQGSTITVDSIDTKVEQMYTLLWRQC